MRVVVQALTDVGLEGGEGILGSPTLAGLAVPVEVGADRLAIPPEVPGDG